MVTATDNQGNEAIFDFGGMLIRTPPLSIALAGGKLRAVEIDCVLAAGGIATNDQIDALDALYIDAVVGMAIYTGRIKLLNPAKRPSLAAGKLTSGTRE
jgi:hypothetical protein